MLAVTAADPVLALALRGVTDAGRVHPCAVPALSTQELITSDPAVATATGGAWWVVPAVSDASAVAAVCVHRSGTCVRKQSEACLGVGVQGHGHAGACRSGWGHPGEHPGPHVDAGGLDPRSRLQPAGVLSVASRFVDARSTSASPACTPCGTVTDGAIVFTLDDDELELDRSGR